MTPLAFLFLLDYSGSMEQKLDKAPKIQTVKTQIGSLLSTGASSDMSEAIIFGTEPQKGCKDVRNIKLPNPLMSKKLSQMNPGPYGKTPLTQGFRLLVEKLKSNVSSKAIVITDGADTCGENPCEYLEKVDKTLKTEKPYDIYLVGLDLKEDKSQMACFKNLKLNNFNIHFSDIDSKEDLLNQLKEAQLPNSDIANEIKDSRLTGATKIKIFKLKNAGAKKANPANNQNKKINEPAASLEITGAPAEAHFHIENPAHQQNWQGPFSISIPGGSYKIQFIDAQNGGEITFKLIPGTLTKIPWAQLMKYATGEVEINSSSLTLRWTPDVSTKNIHGDLKPVETIANLNNQMLEIPKLPFGKWNVEVMSPPWLAKRLRPKNLTIEYNHRNSFNLKELFADEVKWIEAPKYQEGQVMVLQDKDAKEERHFIPPGQTTLPIPASYEVRWLRPEN